MKLGFVDYYIDEYHSNHYPAWFKEAFPKEEFELFVYAEVKSPLENTLTTEEWCEKYNATQLSSIEEVCETADYLVLLAPNNPEKHLEYAQKMLPYRKPTYIDKTFAPDFETAQAIIALAKKYGTPFFSSSALRYASEYKDSWGKATTCITEGTGRLAEVYLIHPVEMVAALMGPGASEVLSNGDKINTYALIKYPDGRSAAIHYASSCWNLPYACTVEIDGARNYIKVESDFFRNLAAAIIEFFMDPSHIPPIQPEDVAEGMRLRDGILETYEKPGVWIKLKSN